jgi:hypothetical protein
MSLRPECRAAAGRLGAVAGDRLALVELAELAADPATARDRWPTLTQAKLAELDAQTRQATAAKRLPAHALACDCARPGQCELVQAAGGAARPSGPSGNPAEWRPE